MPGTTDSASRPGRSRNRAGKDVNDTHGHLAGVKVLCEVADALRVELRGHDLLGRFGGEEFVAFLEGPTLEHATDISERLRHRIAALTTIDALVVTGSVGLAHCTQARNTSLEDLLHMADIALCKAKSAGRNRVGMHTSTLKFPAEPASRAPRVARGGAAHGCYCWSE